MWQFPLNAIAPCSWTPDESQVESCEHQDNANIHCQPFPESVSEEHEIYTDYDGCHRHHVKHDSYLSAHFSLTYNLCCGRPCLLLWLQLFVSHSILLMSSAPPQASDFL